MQGDSSAEETQVDHPADRTSQAHRERLPETESQGQGREGERQSTLRLPVARASARLFGIWAKRADGATERDVAKKK